MNSIPIISLCLLVTSSVSYAQSFQSPGMPTSGPASGQSGRFDNSFNPALGLTLDLSGLYTDAPGSANDGLDLSLRTAELSFGAWVDPTAHAYANFVYVEDELVLEEAAATYVGWDSNATIKAGRFYVDFGKQMQAHIHALRTYERPAVLRTFLGEELGGDGIQYNDWTTMGDATVVRWSLGAFGALVSHSHGHEGEEHEGEGEAEVASEPILRPDLDELALTARLTGFADVSEASTLQLGASVRYLPGFEIHHEGGFVEEGKEVESDLSNTVVGLDATWSWLDESGTEGLTVGGEFLMIDGDLGGFFDDAGDGLGDPTADPADPIFLNNSIAVIDDTATGFYAFVDYALDMRSSLGLQYSQVEVLEEGLPELDEWDVYYTHKPTEFQRMRFGLTLAEHEGERDTRFSLQYTLFLGPHSHGVNF